MPPKSSSVPIDKVSGEDENPNLGFMTPNYTVTYREHTDSSELNTDQGEGIKDKPQFAAEQLNDRICLQTYRFSEDKYGDLPLSPDP